VEKPLHWVFTNRFQQRLGPNNIGLQKWRGVENTSIDVRLGGEIHKCPDTFFRDASADQILIADISLNKPDTLFWKIQDIVPIAGIGELIKVDDAPVRLGAHEPDKIAADKSAAAGHYDGFHNINEPYGAQVIVPIQSGKSQLSSIAPSTKPSASRSPAPFRLY